MSPKISSISIHSSFPASLFRLQQQPKSGLFDYSKSREDMSSQDWVLVSDDELVYSRFPNRSLQWGDLHAKYLYNARIGSHVAGWIPRKPWGRRVPGWTYDILREKRLCSLTWWRAQSLIAPRYHYPQRSYTIQRGVVSVQPSAFRLCVFERYRG